MTRTADLITAAVLLLIGVIVVSDSLRLGAGWGSDGPKSGFFPFWLGVLLLGVTTAIAIQAWRRGAGAPFVTRERLRPVLQVLWPATAMVILTGGVTVGTMTVVPALGLYVAAAIYLAFYMRWVGHHHWITVLVIAVLPGLGGANGVAILLPLTFTMPPTSAIILLTSLYWGALFGGAITSILFNIPGEPWSVATTFDGFPLARQGQGGQALTAAFTSSFFGALFATVLITFFAPLLAEVALKFGPREFFAIQLLTFSSFVGLGGGDPLKSLVSILLGFILGAVGLDIVTGQLRLTFGLTE